MKRRVYLDTSVLSALDDERWPDRATLTRAFWQRRDEFDLCTSEITRQEIDDTPNSGRRDQMTALLAGLTIYPINNDVRARALARRYVDAGIFPEPVIADALHVAAAVLNRCDVLVSWNFKHLVNLRRRAEVAAINQALGLPAMEIVAPPEI